MQGRLPDAVLTNTKKGVQSVDWFPRLTRERDRIRAELKRFAAHPDVASILDLEQLAGILDDWPEHQPPEYGRQTRPLFWALPQALGTALFIEQVTKTNYGR